MHIVKEFQDPKNGQFLPGHHWRNPQPFREKEWLLEEYIVKQRSTGEIAKQFGVTDCAILFWMKKHNIKRRNVSQSRKIKHWGQPGERNWMFGRRSSLAPFWKGGCTPERQHFYSSLEWKYVVPIIFKRDNYKCVRCDSGHTKNNPLHIHHIVSFQIKELRCEPSNLIILCNTCHKFVHSNKNVNKEFIKELNK